MLTNDQKDVVRKVLIDLEAGNWTQWASGRDRLLRACDYKDGGAVRWCVTGSIRRHSDPDNVNPIFDAVANVIKKKPDFRYSAWYNDFQSKMGGLIADYNDADNRKVEEMIAIVKEALDAN